MAQIWMPIKSPIFIVRIQNFGIVHFELEISENRIKNFRFKATFRATLSSSNERVSL